MSKREKIQEYVVIPKRKLNALEKKGRFDPDLATFWMCGNIIAAGKNNTIIRFIPKLIQ